MTINTYAPTVISAPFLIGETTVVSGGSRDAVPTSLTKVSTVPIAAALEIQSTTGAFVPPRMTTTQRTALTPLVAGAKVFDTTVGSDYTYNGTSWVQNTSLDSQTTSGTITAANFIAAYATPQVLIAAPGANKVIIVHRFTLELVWNTVQYTLGGALQLQYGSTNHAGGTTIGLTISEVEIDAAVATSLWVVNGGVLSAGASVVKVKTLLANQGVYLSAATAFATGNSTFFYKIDYSVIDVT